jgi:hypothetical protein
MHDHQQQSQQENKGRYWRLYASVTFAVTLIFGGTAFLALHLHRQSLLYEYTSDTPGRLQLAEVNQNDRTALQDKWSAFYDEISKRRRTAPLTMSPKELNSFISMIPELRDKAVLSIENNRIRVDYAVPLDEHGLNGRYANGVALLDISLGEAGLPTLNLVSLKLNGQEPPGSILSRLDAGNCDKMGSVLNSIPHWKDLEKISIEDGLIKFYPKRWN